MFDAIIVGNQIGGLCAAIELAQAGKKVFVVDTQSEDSAAYEYPSGTFALDQEWEPIFGIYENSKEDEFLKKIGLYKKADTLFPRMTPSLQLISHAGNIDFSYSVKRLEKEWLREFPKYAEQLSMLCKKIILEKKSQSFYQFVESEGLEHQWSQIGEIHVPLLGSILPRESDLSLIKFYFTQAEKGISYAVGGKDAIREILYTRLRWYGAEIKKAGKVEEIVFEHKKTSGVLLSSYEGFIRGKTIIGNMNAGKFLNKISSSYSFTKIENKIAALQPSFWRYNFTIRVPEYLIPEGLAPHACYHDFESDLMEGHFFQIFIAPKNSYSGLLQGQRTILVRTLVPFVDKKLQAELVAANMKRCLKQMEYFIPFMGQEKITVKPNPDCLHDDPLFKKFFDWQDLEQIPDHQIIYSSQNIFSPEDGIPYDWSKYGVPGVFLSSRDVFPAQGFLGDVKTAMEVAKLVLERNYD